MSFPVSFVLQTTVPANHVEGSTKGLPMEFEKFRKQLSALVGNEIQWMPDEPLAWECDEDITAWIEYLEEAKAIIVGVRLTETTLDDERQSAVNRTMFQANAHLNTLLHFTSAITPDGGSCLLSRYPIEEITAEQALTRLDYLATLVTDFFAAPISDQQDSPPFNPFSGGHDQNDIIMG